MQKILSSRLQSFSYFHLSILNCTVAIHQTLVAMGFDSFTGTFLGITPITTGNSVRLNPYQDFNHGIVFQTNENGNWDIAYVPY